MCLTWSDTLKIYFPTTRLILFGIDEEPRVEPPSPVKNVDDFVPDIGELDSSFLEDTKDSKDLYRNTSQEQDSDR